MSEPPVPDDIFPKKKKSPDDLTFVDTKFLTYGGVPEAVDNWQAIALAALDIATELAVGYLKSQGVERSQ